MKIQNNDDSSVENQVAHMNPVDGLIELSKLAVQVATSMGEQIEQTGALIWDSFESGNKILVCGNGGSAADAQHFVAELVGRMDRERSPLPAITLNVDPSVVTALANDYGYENVFARQVEALGEPGDVLLSISTSGSSRNVLRSLDVAQRKSMKTVALVGLGGDSSLEDCDICMHIPSENGQRVQEIHIAVLHAICEYIEERLFSISKGTKGE